MVSHSGLAFVFSFPIFLKNTETGQGTISRDFEFGDGASFHSRKPVEGFFLRPPAKHIIVSMFINYSFIFSEYLWICINLPTTSECGGGNQSIHSNADWLLMHLLDDECFVFFDKTTLSLINSLTWDYAKQKLVIHVVHV